MKLYILLQICFVASCATSTPWKSVDDEVKDAAVDTENVIINDDLVLQLLTRVQHLESRDRAQQSEIDALRLQLKTQKRRTTLLEGIIRNLRHRNAVRKQKVPDVGDVAHDEEQNIKVEQEVGSEKASKTSMDQVNGKQNGQDTKQRIRRESEVTVGFLATLSGDLEHMGVNQNIVFGNIVTNVGNAYNHHNGGFIAPVPGMYVFSVTLLSVRSDSHFEIILNGNLVSNMYIRGQESAYSTASQTVVLVLKQGDDVAVRNKDSDESLAGGHYTSFAGFLLQQDYQNTGSVVGK